MSIEVVLWRAASFFIGTETLKLHKLNENVCKRREING
ncbi:hypothetical protein JOC86_003489 [Bacillus pakistanensis]|uniref:Uncharacterized protein n=1 Tax=Rossellomorea pakistanensis TaxID=992288 RepID=A0ABS2NGE7_9BACI|nr:hypothetical protein [Bacillus pakistanensis]